MIIMRLTTIKVPKGCSEITVDMEDGKLIVSYGSSINSKEFFCKETGHMEEVPGVGDFAILWNEPDRKSAIVANVEEFNKKGFVVGSNGFAYGSAIKFRNYEQYIKVKGKNVENEP